jgi:paraquat-inducible protein B
VPDVNQGIINYGSIGGDARVTSADVHVGDTITVEATNSNVTIKSCLERATQRVGALPAEDVQRKDDLQRLLSQLRSALAKVPATHADEAEAVARQAETALAAATESKPNRTLLQIAGDSLKKAAATLAAVAPPVVAIAKDIVAIMADIAAL